VESDMGSPSIAARVRTTGRKKIEALILFQVQMGSALPADGQRPGTRNHATAPGLFPASRAIRWMTDLNPL